MKYDCDIIRDLLPLYHDGVCSEKSREMVEEHLKECEVCRKALEEIRKEIFAPNTSMKDAGKAWKNLVRNLQIRRIAAAVLVVALIVAAALVGKEVYEEDQERLRFVDVDELRAENVCRLADGRIYLEIVGNEHNISSTYWCESGEPYVAEYTGSYLIHGYWSKATDRWTQWPVHWFVVEPSMETGGTVNGEPVRFITEDIVLTDREHTKEILVCRYDDELPPASAEIEAKAAERDEVLKGLRNG